MLNRRLIFSSCNPPYSNFSTQIERIDNYLEKMKYLNSVNSLISIYGDRASKELKIGREFTGREEEAFFHEELSIEDYPDCEFVLETVEANDLMDLVAKVEKLHLNFSTFRVQWDLSNPQSFQTYFF